MSIKIHTFVKIRVITQPLADDFDKVGNFLEECNLPNLVPLNNKKD